MTKDKAIKKLDALKKHGVTLLDACIVAKEEMWELVSEAVDMAIEALSEPSRQVQRDDLIKRQDAIGAVLDRMDTEKWGRNAKPEEIQWTLERLPSAQPEIIRCKNCIYQKESWCGIKYCEANGDHIGKDYDYCSNVRRKGNERFY